MAAMVTIYTYRYAMYVKHTEKEKLWLASVRGEGSSGVDPDMIISQ